MKLSLLHEAKFLQYRPAKKHKTPGDLTDRSGLEVDEYMRELTVDQMPSMTGVSNWEAPGRGRANNTLRRGRG